MSIFKNIRSGAITNGHGEVNFFKIKDGSVDTSSMDPITATDKGFVVGHSERGHHHLLEADGVTLLRGNEKGMEIFYALLEKPVRLLQDAGSPHAEQIIEPGEYIITNNVEYDPFAEQARRVCD